jgi:hypothetical protein
VIFAAELLECLTQPLFFLVLLELVERSLSDPLIRALRVPVRLPRLVWISSGCGSAVVRRSSRSLRGFGVSLPVAWSHPTLATCKAFYPAEFFFSKLFPLPKPTVMKIGPPFAEPIRCISCGNQSYRCHGRFVFFITPTLFNLLQFFTIHIFIPVFIFYRIINPEKMINRMFYPNNPPNDPSSSKYSPK